MEFIAFMLLKNKPVITVRIDFSRKARLSEMYLNVVRVDVFDRLAGDL